MHGLYGFANRNTLESFWEAFISVYERIISYLELHINTIEYTQRTIIKVHPLSAVFAIRVGLIKNMTPRIAREYRNKFSTFVHVLVFN